MLPLDKTLALIRLAKIAKSLRQAWEPSPALMGAFIQDATTQTSARLKLGLAERLARYCAAEAWMDASWQILAFEAPRWTMRRLVRDGEEWRCAFSQFPDMPIELDDIVERSHSDPCLAFLLGLIGILERAERGDGRAGAALTNDGVASFGLSCENFF